MKVSIRYHKSEQLLERALKTIPLGTQTFSKSKTQFPFGVSPYFIKKGAGSHVWDVDGNEYIDFINGLASVNLGYQDPDVNYAVAKQLENGVIFSLPHSLEFQVAEKLVEMIPCAEMVRFGKNGSDATAGAIRLARAYTKRDHVAVCGYHGWQDWYIGTTPRNLGVPLAVRELSHTFQYNNLASLQDIFRRFPEQIAAVIMEPMNMQEPENQFLQDVAVLTREQDSLLIFDETITGFRFAKGGAQEYFGVVPDLATFGKGMANGYPISAIVGREEIMRMMEELFFSFTFGGETLSLAASLAAMTKIQTQPVIETMKRQGQKILDGIRFLIDKHQMQDVLSVSGHPAWSFLIFRDAGAYSQWQIKTLFLQEVFARGILTVGTHNLSNSHSDQDIAELLHVYNQVFPVIKHAIEHGNLETVLACKPLEPLFKIR